ncbi:unnamed protein product [Calicophoron daubneyi]|uniref:Ras-GAP domain-containing protein n=1 Tax=Calicophoron daubneyi TaxID=300641 RepID=A0AAV2T5U8_CALDB
MATASLPFIDVIDCQPHTSSVDSIISECGTFSNQLRYFQSHGGSKPTNSFDNPTSKLAPVPRRSLSLARNKLNEEAEATVADSKTQTGQSAAVIRRSHYVVNGAPLSDIDADVGSGISPVTARSDRKTTGVKESGGRKILNFFQRGFNTRRPKSVTKMNNRKSSTYYPGFDESLDDQLEDGLEHTLSPAEAINILNEQMTLPAELISIFQPGHRGLGERPVNPIRSTFPVLIEPIDSSLIGFDRRHCFQVTSRDSCTLTPTSEIPTESGLVTLHGNPPSSGVESSACSQPNNCHIRTYACMSALERSRWMLYLKRVAQPERDAKRRRENCLRIWIQEAKGLTGKQRYHCEILLDETTFARTTSKRLTDMLFWGEEFDLSGLPNFSDFTVELWKDSDRGPADSARASSSHRHRTTSPPRTGGRQQPSHSPIPMRKAMMACTRGSEPTHADEILSDPDDRPTTNSRVLKENTENTSNPPKSSPSKCAAAAANRRLARRTKPTRQKQSLQSQLIARVTIPSSKLGNTSEVESWYPAVLQEVHTSTGRNKRSDSGEPANSKIRAHKGNSLSNGTSANSIQLRIKTRHRSVLVLPLASYARLKLCLSRFAHPDASAAYSGDVTKNISSEDGIDCSMLLSHLDQWIGVKSKAELAGSILALQQALGQATDFLVVLILHEVKKQGDPNMVLRGNSIATKATEMYLRLVGENYLSSILSDFVNTVISGTAKRNCDTRTQTKNAAKQARHTPSSTSGSSSENFLDCEVDIAKVQTSTQLAQNQSNLIRLVEMVWSRILSSEPFFPEPLRMMFAAIRKHLDVWFPSIPSESGSPQASLSEHVISACLFLRYICPAILSPSLFGLASEFPSEPRVLRAFTLVAKTIQSLANFSLFAGSKEVYMTFMNQFVSSQLPAMKRFLQNISCPRRSPGSVTGSFPIPSLGDGVTSSQDYGLINERVQVNPQQLQSGRFVGSKSHHGGFPSGLPLDTESSRVLSKPGIDSSSNHPLLIRSISGLPISASQCVPHQSFLDNPVNTTNLADAEPSSRQRRNNSLVVDEYDRKTPLASSSIREPILLPLLPSVDRSPPFSGDHIDLALCLALCHTQLTEAIKKVPENKMVPHLINLKPILDEIDFFLASGVDPSPNWWRKENVPELPGPATGQRSSAAAVPVSTNGVGTVRSRSSGSLQSNHPKPDTSGFVAAVTHTASGVTLRSSSIMTNGVKHRKSGVGESQSGYSLWTSNDLTSSQIKSAHEVPIPAAPFSAVNSNSPSSNSSSDRLRLPSNNNSSSSEMVKNRNVSNQHTAFPASVCTRQPSTPSPVSVPVCKNPFPSEENGDSSSSLGPLMQEEKVNHSTSREIQPSNGGGVRMKNLKESSEDSTLWSIDTDTNMPFTQQIESISMDEAPQNSAQHPKNLHCVASNQMHAGAVYVANSNSSGYQSLVSHGTGGTGLPSDAGTFTKDRFERNKTAPALPPQMLNVNPTTAAAMSNPLYAFHSPKDRPANLVESAASSPTVESSTASIPQLSRAVPARSRSPVPTDSARRHTYVNLSGASNAEAMLASIRNRPFEPDTSLAMEVSLSTTSSPSDSRPLHGNPSLTRHYTVATDELLYTQDMMSAPGDSPRSNIRRPRSKTTAVCRNYPHPRPHQRPESLCSDRTPHSVHPTLYAMLEGLEARDRFAGSDSVRSAVYPTGKRAPLFTTESNTMDPSSIKQELDASQARLAEAQARLLANEAERIQLLRAWHNELLKQSQLVGYSGIGLGFYESPPVVPHKPLDSSLGSDGDHNSSAHVTSPPSTMDDVDNLIPPAVRDAINATANPRHSSSKSVHTIRPRMGASVIGTSYHDSLTTKGNQPDGQSTLPEGLLSSACNSQFPSWVKGTEIAKGSELPIPRSPSTPGLMSCPSAPLNVRPVELSDDRQPSEQHSSSDAEFIKHAQASSWENKHGDNLPSKSSD